MNNCIITTVLILFGFLLVEPCSAKDWRGIAPLRSTRADVVRLLNQCAEQKEASVFRWDREDVYILFSGGLRHEYGECAKSLAPETVMFIQVEPRKRLGLDDLHLNKRMLEMFNPSAPLGRGVKAYRTTDGLVISTLRGMVLQLDYLAETSGEYPCASYYEEPESFVQTFVVHPPVSVSIDCPSKEAEAGSHVALTAYASVNPKRGPTWTVNAGRITSGQHTYKVTVDTSGLAGQTIIVSAEMVDVFGHAVTASCKVPILSK